MQARFIARLQSSMQDCIEDTCKIVDKCLLWNKGRVAPPEESIAMCSHFMNIVLQCKARSLIGSPTAVACYTVEYSNLKVKCDCWTVCTYTFDFL